MIFLQNSFSYFAHKNIKVNKKLIAYEIFYILF